MQIRSFTTLTIAAVLILSAACAFSQTQEKAVKQYPEIPFGEVATIGRPGAFILNTVLPEMPAKVTVYKVLPLESKKDYLLKILKALPVKPSKKTQNILHQLEHLPESAAQKEESFAISYGDWTVEVWDGGQFIISDYGLHRDDWDCDNPPVLPSKDEVRKAADAFLAKLPLLFEAKFSDIETARSLSCLTGGKVIDVPLELYAYYSAELNGIPNGFIGINVGPGSKVSGAVSRIRRTAADEEVPILSPQEAFKELQADRCHWKEDPGSNTCNVDSIKMMYYQGALATHLAYIMPVYVFEGTNTFKLKNGNIKTKHWKALVEAVRPEFLESKPVSE